MKPIILNDNHKIPPIGFGTYKALGEEGIEAIKLALDKGYRLLDTAFIYHNETEVGEAILRSEVPRENIFLATKVWRENMSSENTKRALEASLKKLKLDYLDLYLIHWPANAKNYSNWQKTNAEVWKSMEELRNEGIIKSIGVCNFLVEHQNALYQTAHIKPAVNQIEFHPGYWQQETFEFCQNENIAIEAWSPIARGKILDNELLDSISEKYQKTVSQITLRWIVQHGAIPIPKTVSVERMNENLQVFDFELTESEMEQIDNLPEMAFSGEHPNHWPDKLN